MPLRAAVLTEERRLASSEGRDTLDDNRASVALISSRLLPRATLLSQAERSAGLAAKGSRP